MPNASGRAACRAHSARCCRLERAMARKRRPVSPKPAPHKQAAPRQPAQQDASTTGLWDDLRRLTVARIGLARSGASLATAPLLDFRLAHARARDAVHAPLDEAGLQAGQTTVGQPVLAGARA